MPHQIEYNLSYRYTTTEAGITIPVSLIAGERSAECQAKIDTGAEYCLFDRTYADRLGFEVESGHRVRMETLTGILTAFGQEVTLQTFDLAFEVTVYFAADYNLPRNLLGRNGWLNLIRLGLNAYEEILYLSAYDDL